MTISILCIAGIGVWTWAYASLLFGTWRRAAMRRARRSEQHRASVLAWPELVCLCPLSGRDGVRPPVGRIPLYRGPLSFLFLCAESDAMAQVHAARRVCALRKQGLAAQTVLTRPRGRNQKVAQLSQVPAGSMSPQAMALVLDSDVDFASVDATALVRRLLAPKAPGAVWQATVPHGVVASGADRLAEAVLLTSPYAMPFAALMKPNMAVGKVLAYRPAALASVGGWAACAHVLGEDVHVSQLLRAMGVSVDALDAKPARSIRVHQSPRAVWERFVRWHRIVIEQQSSLLWAYPLLVAFWPMQALAWSTWWGVGGVGEPMAVAGVIAACALRCLLARGIAALCGRRLGVLSAMRMAAAADLLVVASFVRACISRRVTWHGRSVGAGQPVPRLPWPQRLRAAVSLRRAA